MKKFINKIDDVLTESLSGFALAHGDLVTLNLEPNFLTRKQKSSNKVAIISGGGSGHEPLHAGYIGYGMLDAACPGYVFTSPTPDQMLAAATAVHADRGVLFIVKNFKVWSITPCSKFNFIKNKCIWLKFPRFNFFLIYKEIQVKRVICLPCASKK